MKHVFKKIDRRPIPALDAVLGKPFPILNDGFIRLIDYMGSDDAIVQAARVSYGKGTKKISQDRELIRYLMRHMHTSPFEMCEIKLHVRVPMDCWRQWIRHRTANVNEYSTRYSEAIDSAQTTPPGEWRLQAFVNRQGSEGTLSEEEGKRLSESEAELQKLARDVYQRRLNRGVAREQARKDLPLSTYTEAYWKIDLNNLFHFLFLRMDPHAQLEIRAYAECIGREIVRRWCPLAWEAFMDYRMNGLSFSAVEWRILSLMLKGDKKSAREAALSAGWLREKDGKLKICIERGEFESKLGMMDISPPWQRG
ncbi:MAG TPA: FAD-dependent thymidylate synthase [bacterium]|nr:FAD-dependent thymidylate synthase [bacterium]